MPRSASATSYRAAQGAHGHDKLRRTTDSGPHAKDRKDVGDGPLPQALANHARQVVQSFTIGPVMLNQDGTVATTVQGP